MASGGHADGAALHQPGSASDNGDHFTAQHADQRLGPGRVQRLHGLRLDHRVDRALPHHQHDRAQGEARLNSRHEAATATELKRANNQCVLRVICSVFPCAERNYICYLFWTWILLFTFLAEEKCVRTCDFCYHYYII